MTFSLRDRLDAGEVLFTGWSIIPDATTAHALATTAVDCVTLDMQHGGHDERSILESVPRIALMGKPALVRIPVARWDMVSRGLDFGAECIIAPMINSAEDAKAFAQAAKYSPLGARSWGATLGQMTHKEPVGQAYLEQANDQTLALAMIETRQALDVLDDILAIKGIDGVFVGPADFSIAWTGGKSVDPSLEDMMPAIASIAHTAKEAGKYAGVFSMDPKTAPAYIAMGFQLLALGFETHYMAAGADAFIAAAKDGAATLKGGY